METCTICKKYTENYVREPNIRMDIPLCEECKKEFEQCKDCGGHYYPQDLENGYCYNCRQD